MGKLVVISHKPAWRADDSPTGYATNGGFPFQMRALSELFDSTTLVIPCSGPANRHGGRAFSGHAMSIVPMTMPYGSDFLRKLHLPFWLLGNLPILLREIINADAVHTPIPSDVGTLGMILAYLLRKPLFVRHCGNWSIERTAAERFWKWFMERVAGGRNVMLATGGSDNPPSSRNPSIRWIFSTSLTREEIESYRRLRNKSHTPRPPHLITVCRQERYKGIDTVIESLPILMKTYPGITQDIVGTGSALDEFKAKAKALGLNGQITFHGETDQRTVMRLLQQADIFCYPTTSDGFPKVVIEALASGLPVITTRVSVLTKLIGNGCGKLLDDVTPEALARAVSDSLKDDEDYRRMSEKAVETARQYSLEQWRDTIGEILESAWGRERGTRKINEKR